MADLSFIFNASSIATAMSTASAASQTASSAAAKAAAASAAAADGSNALSKITDKSATWDKASAASSAAAVLDTTVIKSVPGTDSRAVHEIIVTSAGLVKYVYSSTAAA